jgi:hypothetical protein
MSKFKSLFTYKPIKITGAIYIVSLLGYNIVSTYSDSKNALLEHRRCTSRDELALVSQYKNEWEAVKEGARKNMWERFTHSIIWPITTIRDSIPWVVLKLNPNLEK